ncbi:MAG: fused response regulator/phosphatase [Taibaiella sp.]|nr:fused response regulator/phosphatase [Taibaiella sp.]
MASDIQKKILVVEDNPAMMKALQIALERNNYVCMQAASATEAIEMMKTEIPGIILSDYEMPIINGFEFRQILLKNTLWRDIPFVFLTSHSNDYLVLQGLNLNALDYIVKGTAIPVIISKLDNILHSLRTEQKKSVRELRSAAEALNAKFIPNKAVELEDFHLAFWHKPFQDYPGGDFIDFIKIDDRYCFVVLGDIMGKKWKAWFFNFGFLSYIRATIRFNEIGSTPDVKTIIQTINRLVQLDDNLQNILCSVSLLLLDSQTGRVYYTGAGDLPIINYNAERKTVTIIESAGLLLGLQEKSSYDEQLLTLDPGDQLILFTDGATDVKLNGVKKSDYSSFVDWLQAYLGTENTFDNIRCQMIERLNENDQIDDASIVFIEKKNNP